MKKILTSLFVVIGMTTAWAQDNDAPEFTGDNFSLEGALAMLKKANTPEDFEKLLNEENNNVNNLDLNNDGNIDYLAVEDVMEGEKHLLVITALLNETEKQDVATIAIEKTGNEEAQVQIFGDDDLFAANTIAEPFDVNEKTTESKGPSAIEITPARVVVNVWLWPTVRFIYAPGYRVWISPVRWAIYPRWWKPWKPYRYAVFAGRCAVHRTFIHRTPTRRVVINRSYAPRRNSSTMVVRSRRGTTIIHQNRRGQVRAVRARRR